MKMYKRNHNKKIKDTQKTASVIAGVTYIPSPNKHWLFSLYLAVTNKMYDNAK